MRGQRHFPSDWLSDVEIPYEVERVAALLAGMAPS
jgi:hypothetical protein